MHGQIGQPYYKGSGPSGEVASTHDGNTANNTGGCGGESLPQKPIPGPESAGGPISLQRALSKRNTGPGLPGPGLPNKNTTAAGSVL